MQLLIKFMLSAALIVSVSEIAKRFSWIAAILASLPLTSIVALCWLYFDTRDVEKVSALSKGIFWAVLPSLVFFIALPLCLSTKLPFWWSMGLSIVVTALAYFVYGSILSKFGIM